MIYSFATGKPIKPTITPQQWKSLFKNGAMIVKKCVQLYGWRVGIVSAFAWMRDMAVKARKQRGVCS